MKLFNQAKKYGSKAFAAVAANALMLPVVFAQTEPPATTYDATQHVAAVMATIAGLLALGGAVFLVHLAIRSTKWGRKAL